MIYDAALHRRCPSSATASPPRSPGTRCDCNSDFRSASTSPSAASRSCSKPGRNGQPSSVANLPAIFALDPRGTSPTNGNSAAKGRRRPASGKIGARVRRITQSPHCRVECFGGKSGREEPFDGTVICPGRYQFREKQGSVRVDPDGNAKSPVCGVIRIRMMIGCGGLMAWRLVNLGP